MRKMEHEPLMGRGIAATIGLGAWSYHGAAVGGMRDEYICWIGEAKSCDHLWGGSILNTCQR